MEIENKNKKVDPRRKKITKKGRVSKALVK
jgi:hypothetical protein